MIAPLVIAAVVIAALIVIVAAAVRGASTDTPRTPGGDDSHNGMYK